MTLLADRPIGPGPSSGPVETKKAPAAKFQTDVEGLRAVAVVGVVAYHASVPFLPGGFVGVDVFFVISGYLITALLLREVESTGRISFVNFYARRARRILPAAGIVFVATAIAMWFVLPLLSVYGAAQDLLAAVFYVANFRFIQQGTDYLAASSDHSVVLHFWSLAVEEQFYLVWPFLMLLVVWVARKLPRARTAVLVTVIGVVTAGSLAACVGLTHTNPSLAYMATYTRAWQFGVGALVAVCLPMLHRARARATGRWLGWIIGTAGMAAIVAGCLLINDKTAYPGSAALLPTLGAGAVIAGGRLWGTGGFSVGSVLSWGPIRTVGRLSFTWYLWHWPVLVLVETKTGPLTWPVRCLLMLGALLLAAITLAVIEEPIMKAEIVRKRTAAAVGVGLIATVLATAATMGIGSYALNQLGAQTKPISAGSFASVFGKDDGRRSGAVTPTALQAKTDTPHRHCILDLGTTPLDNCDFGDATGAKVVLFGDSHAHQWQPAFEQIAADRGWDLMVRAKAGCPVADLTPRADLSIRFSKPNCVLWRQQQLDDIVNNIKPSMVIVSSFSFYIPDEGEVLTAWNKSLDRLRTLGVPIVYIRDTPFPNKQIPDCISGALDDWAKCSFPKVVDASHEPVVTSTLRGLENHVSVIDLDGYLCSTNSCPAVRNGTLLYRDDSHITATVARLLAPAMDQAFVDADLLPAKKTS